MQPVIANATDQVQQQLADLEVKVDRLLAIQDALPTYAAIAADSTDEIAQKLQSEGINISDRLEQLAKLADLISDPRTVSQLEALLKFSESAPGLMAIGVDAFDEFVKAPSTQSTIQHVTTVVDSTRTHREARSRKTPGLLRLVALMRDPDRRYALAFFMDLLKGIGIALQKENT